jgi:hypothetical protein
VRLDDDVEAARRVNDQFLKTYYGGTRPIQERGIVGLGPADAVIAALKRYEEVGVTDLCIRFSGEDQRQQLERFGREVLPAFA